MTAISSRVRTSFDVTVQDVREIAEGVARIVLFDTDGSTLPPWSPGAHVEVRLPSGKVRQYSLCGPLMDRDSYTISVLREQEGRGGSVEIHSTIKPGQDLTVLQVRNNFLLDDESRYVFIAGGIGITPILPMIEEAKNRDREWHLYYGGRTRQSMAFLDVLETDILEGRVTVLPQSENGRLDIAGLIAAAPADAGVYCCGPVGLIRAVEDACRNAARPSPHFELFTAAEPPVVSDAEDQTGFIVELSASGQEVEIPADRSILDVVRGVMPDVAYSCEEGWCGSCETVVLDGQPVHRDTVLTPEQHAEAGSMMICVSRCAGKRLVLDL